MAIFSRSFSDFDIMYIIVMSLLTRSDRQHFDPSIKSFVFELFSHFHGLDLLTRSFSSKNPDTQMKSLSRQLFLYIVHITLVI
jgi:hypothetical protein